MACKAWLQEVAMAIPLYQYPADKPFLSVGISGMHPLP
jgi:hypothetical protein